jgi:amidophosphoribosyltransferase
MTEQLKHECGIVLLRLLKPIEFYKKKYGSELYGLQKMYLLMEKQHNRGQDGAGLVTVNLNNPPGNTYIFRERSNNGQPIKDVFDQIRRRYNEAQIKQK